MHQPPPHLPPLLLIEDDAAFRQIYRGVLEEAGYEVREADDRESARAALAEALPGVVILDLMLPPDSSASLGLEQLGEICAQHPGTKVIVASGVGDTRHMLEAVRRGAYDFLTKPVDPDVLLIVVQRAVERWSLEQRVHDLQSSLAQVRPEQPLLGAAPAFLEALRFAERVAPTDLPVLITGENGTGKELMARHLHDKSERARGPFVAVNCGALTESLLESTLFGHVRGAFTGAVRDRRGLFVEANQGTLFLDEIGDMPLALQVKLLRALETGEILPVGRDRPVQVQVRVISATNRDLAALQAESLFREDLYWRVRGAEIHMPALRDRRADLSLLAARFLEAGAALAVDGSPRALTPAALTALQGHDWPGNLRELRFEMQRATVLAGERLEIRPQDLSFVTSAAPAPEPPLSEGPAPLALQIEALERRELARALEETGGNRTHAAARLGLSRQGLLKKLARYGIG